MTGPVSSPDLDLDKLRALLAAGTPTPWRADDEHGDIPNATPAWCVARAEDGRWRYDIAYTTGTHEEPDAHLIVAAVNSLPSLLVLVGQLQDENQRLQLHLDEWQSTDAIEQAVQRRQDAQLAAARAEVGQLREQLTRVRSHSKTVAMIVDNAAQEAS